jgi:hypothetical protein
MYALLESVPELVCCESASSIFSQMFVFLQFNNMSAATLTADRVFVVVVVSGCCCNFWSILVRSSARGGCSSRFAADGFFVLAVFMNAVVGAACYCGGCLALG